MAASSKKSSRTGWFPIVLSQGDKLQVRIMCQRYDGTKGLYSSSPPASKSRPPWQPINECFFIREKKNEIEVEKFLFSNVENDKQSWDLKLILPLMFGANPFTQMCSQLVLEQKYKLLSLYYTVTARSPKYVTHNKNCNELGLHVIDEDGITEGDIINEGGSVEQLKEFQLFAYENAVPVSSNTSIKLNNDKSCNKRKTMEDFFFPDIRKKAKSASKMSRKERTQHHFHTELNSSLGLEKNLVRTYLSYELVHISKLKIDPNISFQLNSNKVNELVESIGLQPDPASFVLTVVPENVKNYEEEGEENKENMRFNVICGMHRLEAFKELEKQNKLEQIGLKGGNIPCFISKAQSHVLANYAYMRSNDHKSKFTETIAIEDLIILFCDMLKRNVKNDIATEIVKRMCYTRKTSSEDVTALLKILKWPVGSILTLENVIKKFQNYSTSDASEPRSATSLKKRELKKLTKVQFRQLGKCSHDYFDKNYSSVLSNTKSLKLMLLESEEWNKMERTKESISQLAGNIEFSKLTTAFPQEFDENSIKKFHGAEPFGNKKNEQGVRLKHYVRSIIKRGDKIDPLVLTEIEKLNDINLSEISSNDVIVVDCKPYKKEWLDELLQCVFKVDKQFFSILLILPSEEILSELLLLVKSFKQHKENFIANQIFFEQSSSKVKDGIINQNVTTCLLIGRPFICGSDVFSFVKGRIDSELKKLISKITTPSSKIAYVSCSTRKIITIHMTDSSNEKITYYGLKACLNSFIKTDLPKYRSSAQVTSMSTYLYSIKESENSSQSPSVCFQDSRSDSALSDETYNKDDDSIVEEYDETILSDFNGSPESKMYSTNDEEVEDDCDIKDKDNNIIRTQDLANLLSK